MRFEKELDFKPVAAELWNDLEKLFEFRGHNT